jgi:hypothetical protein
MKKRVLTALAAGLCCAVTTIAQVPSYVPTNGLVGWWPFNGNANDESGNGNNGTVNGATLSTDRNGILNKAYYFSSSGCGTRIDVDLINSNQITTELTLSYWALQSGNGCIAPRIMEFYSPGDGPGTLGSQQWNSYWTISHVLSNNTNVTLQGNPITTNNWYQITYTNDGTVAKLYQNGNLVLASNVSGNPILSSDFAIGRMNHPAFDAHEGKIDDIGIWNRALTEAEITSLYQGCSVNPSVNPITSSVSSGSNAQFTTPTISGGTYQWQTAPAALNWQNVPSNATILEERPTH